MEMNRVNKIEIQCDSCNGKGVIEGDNIYPKAAYEALKEIGWMIGTVGTLCPGCRRRAEQNLLKEIFSESVSEDE